MESENRKRKRKPLSDCTNTTPISYTLRPKPKPTLSNKNPNSNSLNHEISSIESNNNENPINSSTPHHKSSQLFDSIVLEGSDIRTVYSRHSIEEKEKRKRKRKGKAVAVMMPLSCPPVGRIWNFGDKLKEPHGDIGLSKAPSVSRLEGKQDFVNKQRAYFAEIDAFELQEEVVSESELE
ncbi:uncharacterized protein LOC143855524 isoform X2 [Tasmannia lanceolata]|uniref:uncharacterized protein LOC143855524 isoform X2 n=1 Tax=Tasmannia lanceolata TaxID=3420 RepID=UPI0040627CAF